MMNAIHFSALKLIEPLRFENGKQSFTVKATGKDKKRLQNILGRDNHVTISVKDDEMKRQIVTQRQAEEMQPSLDADEITFTRNGQKERIQTSEQYNSLNELLHHFNVMTEQFQSGILKAFNDGLTYSITQNKLLGMLSAIKELPLSDKAAIMRRIDEDGLDSLT